MTDSRQNPGSPDGADSPVDEVKRVDPGLDDELVVAPGATAPLPEEDLDVAARAVDHDLIRRAQTGEELAFQLLVERHQQRAWRVARNMVASDEDAQDLAQEAFLRVFRNLESFDFKHGFTTWLYRIVTNLAIDHLRKRRPTMRTSRVDDDDGEFELADPDAEAPSQGLERTELARQVKACLESLAPHFQSVLVLREIEGLPCSEIAEIVGATNVTVRWRLHRGRKLFQDEWERRARLADSAIAGSAPIFTNESDPDDVDHDIETEPS